MNHELIAAWIIWGFAILHFLKIYFGNRLQMTLCDLVVWISCTYVGGGMLLSVAAGYKPVIGMEAKPYAVAFATLLFCMGLLFAKTAYPAHLMSAQGGRQRGAVSKLYPILEACGQVQFKDILFMYGILWMIRSYDIYLGGGFSGTNTLSFMLSRPYPVVILDNLLAPVGAMVVIASLMRIMRHSTSSQGPLFIFFLELLHSFTSGRRGMLNVVVIAGLAVFAKNKRIKSSHAVLLGVLGLFLVSVVFPVFLDVRESLQTGRITHQKTSIMQSLGQYFTKSTDDKSGVKDAYIENLQGRGITNFKWIEGVAIGTETRGYMWGDSTISAAMKALPRMLRPRKYWFDHASFIQTHLGMRHFDASDNMVASGMIDFGYAGAFLFGFLSGLLFQWSLGFVYRSIPQNPVMSLLIFFHIIPLVLMFEESVVAYFVTFRSIALILGFSYFQARLGIRNANPFMGKDGRMRGATGVR